jgi:hypothetical protein
MKRSPASARLSFKNSTDPILTAIDEQCPPGGKYRIIACQE